MPGVGSSHTIYGTRWFTSNHPVCLLEMSGYLHVMNFFMRVTYTAKCIGEWQEARIVQIDFSAAFDWVNHQGILYKLFCVGFLAKCY